MCAVRLSARLVQGVVRARVHDRGRVSAGNMLVLGRLVLSLGGMTYFAQREDRIGALLLPLQKVSRGFLVMEPDQASPAQPTSFGTTIWTTALNGV